MGCLGVWCPPALAVCIVIGFIQPLWAYDIMMGTSCPVKAPFCANSVHRFFITNDAGDCTQDVNISCADRGVGRSAWGYFRASATSLTLQLSLVNRSAEVQAVLWGPFGSPHVCGSALGKPQASACPGAAGSGVTTLSTGKLTQNYYYVMRVTVVSDATDAPVQLAIQTSASSTALDCTLLAFFVRRAVVSTSGTASLTVEGSAVAALNASEASTVRVASASTCIDDLVDQTTLAAGATSVVISTIGLSGANAYFLCLRSALGQYSSGQAAAFEVRSWAVQPSSVSVESVNGTTLTVTGKNVNTPVTVAVIRVDTPCDDASLAIDQMAVILTSSSLPLASWKLSSGEYRICFQYYGRWWPQLYAPLTIVSPFYLTSPADKAVGRSFNVSILFAGNAVPAATVHQVALLPAGSTCTSASTGALRASVSKIGVTAVAMDLAALSPGTYRVCYHPWGASFNNSWQDTLTILDFYLDRPAVQAAAGQTLGFGGSLTGVVGAAVALVPQAVGCAGTALVQVAPYLQQVVDLHAWSPGLYRACLFTPDSVLASVSLVVMPGEVQVQPSEVARSVRAQLAMGAEGLLPWNWSRATLLPAELNCSVADLDPLGLVQVLSGGGSGGWISTEWNLSAVPAGQYRVCMETSQDEEWWPSAPFTVVDLYAPSPYISPSGPLVLRGALILGVRDTLLLAPWPTQCSASSATSFTSTSFVEGLLQQPVQLTEGQELRVCLLDPQTASFRDGWDVYVKASPAFRLAVQNFTQNALARFQVEGTSLTGSGDMLTVQSSADCLKGATTLLGAVGGTFNLSTLAGGVYYVCLRPGGLRVSNLVQQISIASFSASPATVRQHNATLTFSGTLVAGAVRVSILAIAVDCVQATEVEYSLSTSASIVVDFAQYVPGWYKVCCRPSSGRYTTNLFVNLVVAPNLLVAPQLFARSTAAQLSVSTAHRGQLALIPRAARCSLLPTDAVALHSVPKGQATLTADFSTLAGGLYRLCLTGVGSAANGSAAISLLDFRVAPQSSVVTPAYSATLVFLGTAAEQDVGAEVVVLPASQSCTQDGPSSSVTAVVQDGIAKLSLSSLQCGNHRVCIRGSAGPFDTYQDGVEVAVRVVATAMPQFFPLQIPAGSVQRLTLDEQGRASFNTQPGGDQLCLVPVGLCNVSQAVLQTTDLGPDDSPVASLATWLVNVSTPGQYRVCYRASGQSTWTQLDSALEVTAGFVDFTGWQGVRLEAGVLQLISFSATSSPTSSARRLESLATTEEEAGEVAFATGGYPWQGDGSAGCSTTPYAVGPIPVQSDAVTLTFPSPGLYTLCYRASRVFAFASIGTFAVASYGCSDTPGGSTPPFNGTCLSCDRCADEWYWLWPVIGFPFVGLQVAAIMGLLLCPKDHLRRVRHCFQLQRYGNDFHNAEDTEGPEGEEMLQDLLPNVPDMAVDNEALLAESRHVARQLDGHRAKIEELKQSAPPPIRVRRIEIPVERRVEVPVTHVEERPVHVEKVVTVEKPKIVEEEVVVEVEKEVLRERPVEDPTIGLRLQWAEEDVGTLQQALAATTAELEEVEAQLRARGWVGMRSRAPSHPTSGRPTGPGLEGPQPATRNWRAASQTPSSQGTPNRPHR